MTLSQFESRRRYNTASYIASPGGEPQQNRGTALGVYKKLPDGRWKVFRAMGIRNECSTSGLVSTSFGA